VDVALHATCTLKPKVLKHHPEEDIGSHAPKRHYVGQIMPEGVLTLPHATYEEIVYPLAMALGEETPTSGNGAPYTWTWVIPDATSPTMVFFTLEYSDGGTYVVRGEAIFAKALTISGEAAGGWKVAVVAPNAAPTPITMAATTLHVDTTYAGIGTNTTEELISFNWKLENLLHSKQFAGSLSPNGRGSGRWKITLELVLEVAAAEAQAFADAVLTATQYAVRVKGYVDADDSINVDGMYMVESVDTLDDRDDNNIIKVTLLGEKDASNNCGQIVVINDIDAL
jgi:hypothetical protein